MGIGNIEHIFVLMMENRSFDHMLGFSGISGTDAQDNSATQVEGLPPAGGTNYDLDGTPYTTASPAPFLMPADPDHEFDDVRQQLLGTKDPAATYTNTPITSGGFVLSYKQTAGTHPLGDVLACFAPGQLPVLNALAKEFCVCDHWFSSVPGPTIPNRFFLHAGTSGGNPDSPNSLALGAAVLANDASYRFANGNIFKRLTGLGVPWALYHGDDFAMVYALEGVSLGAGKPIDPNSPDPFRSDLENGNLPPYVFIEPNWGNLLLGTYTGGNSQHPVDDATSGERFIKFVYETIRASSVWTKCALILLYDEHGGFYDHVTPPGGAVAPGDAKSTNGFDFTQLGVRVPAIVISPWIPKNVIDHSVYDHTSVLATLSEWFPLRGLPALGHFTGRDQAARTLSSLFSLPNPRLDALDNLNGPAPSGLVLPPLQNITTAPDAAFDAFPGAGSPLRSTQAGFVQVALKHHLQLAPDERESTIARVRGISTNADAKRYLRDVKALLDASD
jgi:phospholipase C